ncbi:gas vesicle protein [Saccharopolyspora subtropica]|uniref:Gas vesicle protein n=1 Tax=Saccharopolyspora thermophila TaxID=89367 RepID=A0A917NCI0_9PSEU|nr:gas vesicle protein [Saccharopolyspora subtropica]GGI87431.1 gas vesicle protein [Saccharopolyspora subtropica]
MATARDDDRRGAPAERPRRPRAREPDGDEAHARPRRPAEDDDRPRSAPPALKAPQAARMAVRHVAEMTGKDAEGVTSLQRSDEGWLVHVEVVETHRVPDTMDILAVYEVQLDEDGDLLSYRRIDRYARGRGRSDEG